MNESHDLILNILEVGFLGEFHLLHAHQEALEIRGRLGGVLEEPSVDLNGLYLSGVGFSVGVHQVHYTFIVLLERLMLPVGVGTQVKVVRLGPRVHEHRHEGRHLINIQVLKRLVWLLETVSKSI